MLEEIQVCREIIADSIRMIAALRDIPYYTNEHIVRKLVPMLESRDPQATAMLAVVAIIMLDDVRIQEEVMSYDYLCEED